MQKLVSVVLLAAAWLGGCGGGDHSLTCPRVLYLDGAGWYTSDASVRKGLVSSGYSGQIERFEWSAVALGPLGDHMLAGPDHPRAGALARKIEKLREANPYGQLDIVGLSAGSGIVVYALEQLPPGVMVDHVVLLSPSISSNTDLSEALSHVRYRLYYTQSSKDALLRLGSSAGVEGGEPAGRAGFMTPDFMSPSEMRQYDKVTPLLWAPEYAAYGWDGGHLSVTSSEFIRVVIAPRLKDEVRHPLDRTLVKSRAHK